MTGKLKEYLQKEFENYFAWIPVFLSFGILIYFILPIEPSLYFSFVLSGILFIILVISFFKKFNLFKVSLLMFCIALGFSSALLRTYSADTKTLEKETGKVWVKGKVAQIQHMQVGKRILLRDVKIYDKNVNRLNNVRLSIRTKSEGLSIGDTVKLAAVLLPPPKPITPHGYDFSRYAYFKNLSAIGYAVNKIRVVEKSESSLGNFFVNLRNKVIERVKANLSEPMAGIANGILVGDSSSISKADYDIVRISGIAHLLAISGMHMVVVVAILFISIRFLIIRSEYLALRIDAKKAAAGVALIGSTLYLLLTLAPVSAQRAYIMSSIILLAIILDHNSSALRAVAIAAIIILVITPEEVLSPSLQMSFVASLALISSFGFFNKFLIKNSDKRYIKLFNYFISIIFSTLIAGLATAPFIVYHFNQFSPYSVLTNLIAIPINDFWVMPFGLLSLILMPLGAEQIPIAVMGYGISLIFKVASIISALPYSSFSIPSFSNIGIFLIYLGSIGLFVSVTHLRFIFVIPLLIGLFTKNPYLDPDILIENNGKIFAIRVGGELIFSSKQGAKFTREAWKQAYMQKEVKTLKQLQIPTCTLASCLYNKHGKNILIYSKGEINCDAIKPDLAVNLGKDYIKCPAQTKIIGLPELKRGGNLAIWLAENNIKITYSGSVHKLRPWH
ncbi:ComEC/Rec2 family protein [endosymbiont of Acanthamoeba sp. UWC8]|uniref:ComEC/Rec2 family competence protein n=1 Tax=endosymbiont of Acanthamoeba sp. UWC8 TaxID=86106 RepID=UPI0004D190F2|nr:ComEC/Rec2 family competence protein [endosymbiont of Acanthamoeba sp. UWC8]AIF81910.1 ComEC/Rec2 family protein [endosymbiont of Acanthamoeba sp. UWC8]